MSTNQKITYTITVTQDPADWNIANLIKILEQARASAFEAKNTLIEKRLEVKDYDLANNLISKIKAKL